MADSDDDFGDLYTDVLLPAPSAPAAVDVATVEAKAAPSGRSEPDPAGNGRAEATDDDAWLLGDPLAVEPPANWADEVEDAAEKGKGADRGGDGNTRSLQPEVARVSAAGEAEAGDEGDGDDAVPFLGIGSVGKAAEAIPGLSAATTTAKSLEAAAAGGDWDSDSEDDLQIVLNDDRPPLRSEMVLGGDDEEGDDDEDLVIVTNDDHIHRPMTGMPAMDAPDWVEELPPGLAPDGEKKEAGEAMAKIGGPPGTVAPGARIGYSGHGAWNAAAHHSMYKYVRPGAAPIAGTGASGPSGQPGQFRPPLPSGPYPGRGRGDWRNKGFYSGYGTSGWQNGGRGFGGGLDFTLPAHKTVFDVDIDGFEEKPWKYPGVDVSDFFNFGLDEDKWKEYCKQLEQLRLESTMQSRIRVYESGRSEQDFDPDLPPELAAATGRHEIAANVIEKVDEGQADGGMQGRGPTVVVTPMLVGRPIQVEAGFGERLPSIDTRVPRMRDTDAIIEIVLQEVYEDSTKGALVEPVKDVAHVHVIDGDRRYAPEKFGGFSRNLNAVNREIQSGPEGGYDTNAPADAYAASQKKNPARHGSRSLQDSLGGGKNSKPRAESPRETAAENNEDSDMNGPDVSDDGVSEARDLSPAGVKSSEQTSMEERSGKDEKVGVVHNVEAESATPDPHTAGELNGGKAVDAVSRRKLSSRVEQPQANDNNYRGSDEAGAFNSDNSRGASGGKEYQKHPDQQEDAILDGRPRRLNDSRKQSENPRRKDNTGGAKTERSSLGSRSRENSQNQHMQRDRDGVRGKGYDRASASDGWQRREGDFHTRTAKDDDKRADHGSERGGRPGGKARSNDRNDKDDDLRPRSRLGDGEVRSSRPRERRDISGNCHGNSEDVHGKRRKDEETLRIAKIDNGDASHADRPKDDTSHRKKEKDDAADHKRRENNRLAKEKMEDSHAAKHTDDSLRAGERDDRKRHKPHEGGPSLRERDGRGGTPRVGQVVENRAAGGGRGKDGPRSGTEKDYQERDRNRNRYNEQSRMDRGRKDNSVAHKEHEAAHQYDKRSNHDERNARLQKSGAQDGNRMPVERKDNKRKGRGSDEDQQRQMQRARKHEESNNDRTDKVDAKGSSEADKLAAAAAYAHNSLAKQREEDPASDDDNLEESRRGRSKLERWTSTKDIDYTSIDVSSTFSAPIKAEVQAPNADDLGKSEATAVTTSSSTLKGAEACQNADKLAKDRDSHLETFERLKRRSERFKLPMPGEKELSQSKAANDPAPPDAEAAATASASMDVKPERPARKRKWTGS